MWENPDKFQHKKKQGCCGENPDKIQHQKKTRLVGGIPDKIQNPSGGSPVVIKCG